MDFELTPEQELIRTTAREFADRELIPNARDWDAAEELDRGIVRKLAELGFLAAALPEEHGGMGLDTLSYTLIVEEFGRGDSSVRGIVSVSNGLYGKTVAKWGNAKQRATLLPPLVFARTGEAGARGITCFVVPTGTPGFEARPIKGKLGLRAQDTAELFLDGVRVPDSARLGELGQGFKVAMTALDAGRISLGAGAVGIAQGCLEAAVEYARERRQFARPIAQFQLVQELLADIAVETEAARLLVRRAAAAADAGRDYRVEASYAKYFASEVAVRAANAALQVHGGYGYVDEYPVGKYLRDARVLTLYEGTS